MKIISLRGHSALPFVKEEKVFGPNCLRGGEMIFENSEGKCWGEMKFFRGETKIEPFLVVKC